MRAPPEKRCCFFSPSRKPVLYVCQSIFRSTFLEQGAGLTNYILTWGGNLSPATQGAEEAFSGCVCLSWNLSDIIIGETERPFCGGKLSRRCTLTGRCCGVFFFLITPWHVGELFLVISCLLFIELTPIKTSMECCFLTSQAVPRGQSVVYRREGNHRPCTTLHFDFSSVSFSFAPLPQWVRVQKLTTECLYFPSVGRVQPLTLPYRFQIFALSSEENPWRMTSRYEKFAALNNEMLRIETVIQ